MFGPLGKAWKAVKDNAVETAAKVYLNQKISAFGNVTRLQIDSGQRRVFVEAELKGEITPVSVEVERYEMRRRDGEHYLTVKAVNASREWLAIVLRQYFVDREFRVPANIARFAGGNERDSAK